MTSSPLSFSLFLFLYVSLILLSSSSSYLYRPWCHHACTSFLPSTVLSPFLSRTPCLLPSRDHSSLLSLFIPYSASLSLSLLISLDRIDLFTCALAITISSLGLSFFFFCQVVLTQLENELTYCKTVSHRSWLSARVWICTYARTSSQVYDGVFFSPLIYIATCADSTQILFFALTAWSNCTFRIVKQRMSIACDSIDRKSNRAKYKSFR